MVSCFLGLFSACDREKDEAEKKFYMDSGVVQIVTEPGNAQVFINGERKGNSTSREHDGLILRLPEGTYIITSKKEDETGYEYFGVESDVYVAKGTVQTVYIKMTKHETAKAREIAAALAEKNKAEVEATKYGFLYVSTEPGGSLVFLNGQRWGTTPDNKSEPLILKLPTGFYNVEAKKPDGSEYEYKGMSGVSIVESFSEKIHMPLQRQLTIRGRAQRELIEKKAMERYQVSGGTIIDTATGLTWMRCSLGQMPRGSDCVGQIREYTWDAARQAAMGHFFEGRSDWRLPTLEELDSLVFCSKGTRKAFEKDGIGGYCELDFLRPTLVHTAFPSTPDEWFWSSTVHQNDRSIWGVDFSNGSRFDLDRNNSRPVRLVRSGK